MKRFLYILLIVCLEAFSAEKAVNVAVSVKNDSATDVKVSLSKADSLYKSGRYREAFNLYKEKLSAEPKDAKTNYMAGACLFYGNRIGEAMPFLLKAKDLAGARLMIGDIYMREYMFDKATAEYESVLSSTEQKSFMHNAGQRRLIGVENAQRLLKSVEKVIITDSMTVAKNDFFKHYTPGKNSGYLFRSENCDKQYSEPITGHKTQREDRQLYTSSADGSKDIWIKDKLMSGWSDGRKIGRGVNTLGDENFPFIMEDGITVYFCSTHHGSIGGYDIYMAQWDADNNEFRTPMQLPMPFNSPWNDYMMVIDEEKGSGQWATDRFTDGDSVKIYTFKVNDQRDFFSENVSLETRIEYAQLKRLYKHTPSDTSSYNISDTVTAIIDDSINDEDIKIDTTITLTEAQKQQAISFKINDTTVYTKLDQFLSGESRAYYLQATKLQEERNRNTSLLEQKRIEYSKTDDAVEKRKISAEILRLERRLGASARTAPDRYFKIARNYEIRAISRKLKEQMLRQQQQNNYN